MTDRRFSGRTYVITGASRGIGRSLARSLAAKGADLILCTRDKEALRRVADELRSEHEIGVDSAVVDVADREAVQEWANAVGTTRREIAGVVNNAAVLGPIGAVDQINLDTWTAALETNVAGAVAVTAAFLPLMTSHGGSVVNLSGGGIGGPTVPTRVSAYVASKAALVALTETLGAELAPRRVRVNAVAPGAVATNFLQGVLDADPLVADTGLLRTATDASRPEEPSQGFLDLVEYLLSDASSWLTGRLLSARWDSVAILEEQRGMIVDSSLFTLRRIDDALFTEVPRDSPVRNEAS